MNQTEHDNALDHGSIIVDADNNSFHIDITTRAITNTENKKTSLIQYDHNSERFSFDIARYIEGHDLQLCNRVQIHYLNIAGTSRTKTPGVYPVTDLHVDPDNENKMCFTWLISGNATHYEGALSFLVSFACVKEDEVLYRWNSDICTAITIAPGIDNSSAVVENYPDVLLQWEEYLTSNFEELESELLNNVVPALVNQCYVDREFATSEEVGSIFNTEASDVNYVNSAITIQDLSASGFTPVANTYYKHSGATTENYTNGYIYFYDGNEYEPINGKPRDKTYIKEFIKRSFTQVGVAQRYFISIPKSEHGLTNPYVNKMLVNCKKDNEEETSFDTPVVVHSKTLSTGTIKIYITIDLAEYTEYSGKIYLIGE